MASIARLRTIDRVDYLWRWTRWSACLPEAWRFWAKTIQRLSDHQMERISGITLLYAAAEGEKLKLLPDGRVLIAHAERPLMVRRATGQIERVTPESDPDI